MRAGSSFILPPLTGGRIQHWQVDSGQLGLDPGCRMVPSANVALTDGELSSSRLEEKQPAELLIPGRPQTPPRGLSCMMSQCGLATSGSPGSTRGPGCDAGVRESLEGNPYWMMALKGGGHAKAERSSLYFLYITD